MSHELDINVPDLPVPASKLEEADDFDPANRSEPLNDDDPATTGDGSEGFPIRGGGQESPGAPNIP